MAQARNMFANAPTKSPKAKLKDALSPPVEIKGLDNYAASDATKKSVEALMEVEKVVVQDAAMLHWMSNNSNTRPNNINAFETVRTPAVNAKGKPDVGWTEHTTRGNIQMRKRSSLSVLKDEEKDVLDAKNIPYKTVLSAALNEEALLDPKIQLALSNALQPLIDKGTLPANILQPVQKHIVTEESIDAVFKLDKADKALLIPIVTTFSIKPNYGGDLEKASMSVLGNAKALGKERGEEFPKPKKKAFFKED